MTERNFEEASILVTGGAGFIGSNFIHLLRARYPKARVINFDKLTYAGNLANLKSLETDTNYRFERGDIASKKDVEDIFNRFDIDCVVNFAAESHVDRSIHDVSPFIETNIQGTVNLMEAAGNKWKSKDNCFVQVSTDEVYGSLGKTGLFTEQTPVAPKNPYSSSKAGADMMVLAFVNTHDFPALITRCSNNYGPYQFPEKLIPLTIINILNGKEIPVYGDGKQIRDWIFVEDHCSGVETILRKGRVGEVYNLGGKAEMYNIDLVHIICELCDKAGVSKNSKELITYVTDRPGHDRRYAMDISKVGKELGWSPKQNTNDALAATVIWYLENKNWWTELLNRDYNDYYKKQYEAR